MAIYYPQKRNHNDSRLLFLGSSKDDQSVFGDTGTLVGTATVASGALVLDGDSDYLSFADTWWNSFFDQGITIGVWFSADTVDTADQSLVSKWDEGNNNRSFDLAIVGTSDTVRSILSSAGTASDSTITSTETVTPATDTFVVVTYNNTEHKLFIDGVEVGSDIYSNGIFNSNEVIAMGANFNTTAQKFFDGTVYQSFLLGRVLSPTEVMRVYQRGRTVSFPKDATKQLLFCENFIDQKLVDQWIVFSGSYIVKYDTTLNEYYLECLTAGVIGVPAPNVSNSLNTFGFEWEFDMYKASAGTAWIAGLVADQVSSVGAGGFDGYSFQFGGAEQLLLGERTGGTLNVLFDSVNSFANAAQWYTVKVTRTISGSWTTYLDDTIVTADAGTNPLVDATHTNNQFFTAELNAGDRVKNMKIRRF